MRLGATAKGSSRAATSTASRAMMRYVVYLPPAMLTSPGAPRRTVCSREMAAVSLDPSLTSGRRPTYTPVMSASVSGTRRTAFT